MTFPAGSRRFCLTDVVADSGSGELPASHANPTATQCLQKLPSAACGQVQSPSSWPPSSRNSTRYISVPSTLAVILSPVTRRRATVPAEKYSSPRRKVVAPASFLSTARVIRSSFIRIFPERPEFIFGGKRKTIMLSQELRSVIPAASCPVLLVHGYLLPYCAYFLKVWSLSAPASVRRLGRRVQRYVLRGVERHFTHRSSYLCPERPANW